MANKALQGKVWGVPESVIREVRNALKHFDGHGKTQGYTRAKKLVDSRNMTYENLKRVKNWFDKNTDKESSSYKLNGGDSMKQWVENTLIQARNLILNNKNNQARVGAVNQYRSVDRDEGYKMTHRNMTQSQEARPRISSETKLVARNGLKEEIQQINSLIKRIL